VIVYMVYNK